VFYQSGFSRSIGTVRRVTRPETAPGTGWLRTGDITRFDDVGNLFPAQAPGPDSLTSPSQDQCGMRRPSGTSSADRGYLAIAVVVAQAK
jgi:hypothetical protein